MIRSAALLLFLLPAAALPAQQPGTRVRVDAPGSLPRPLTGTLIRNTPDTTTLDVYRGGVFLHVPAAAIRRLDYSIGHERARWAMMGGIGGALGGGLLGMVLLGREDSSGFGALGGLIGGGLLGGAAGLIGGAAGAPEVWLPYGPEATTIHGRNRLEVRSGARLRVTMAEPDGSRHTGYAAGTTSHTLMLQPSRRAPADSIGLARIRRIEVPAGRNRTRGALLGAGALGGIGLVFGGIDLAHDRIDAGTFAGVVLSNAAIGAGIGYLLAPKGWREVPLPGTAP